MNYIISIYLDDGRVFEYTVDSPNKVREHASAIILSGYRHSDKDTGIFEWYPPHRIIKIKSTDIDTQYYTENIRGT